MSTGLAPDRVAAESAAWLWFPDDADVVSTDQHLLVRWPDYFAAPPSLLRVAGTADVDDALDAAVEQARAWGADAVRVWVRLDGPPGLDTALTTRGAVPEEVLDVFALDLAGPVADLAAPDDVEVRWQVDEATTRDTLEVAIAAFEEGTVPDDARVAELAAVAAADHAAGRGSNAVAYLGGRAVGSGGLAHAGDVARLWGGGVVPDARGRGVYRAVLAARLDLARTRGASMALVKGRVQTSGPILRRAGFAVFGQERSFRLPTVR